MSTGLRPRHCQPAIAHWQAGAPRRGSSLSFSQTAVPRVPRELLKRAVPSSELLQSPVLLVRGAEARVMAPSSSAFHPTRSRRACEPPPAALPPHAAPLSAARASRGTPRRRSTAPRRETTRRRTPRRATWTGPRGRKPRGRCRRGWARSPSLRGAGGAAGIDGAVSARAGRRESGQVPSCVPPLMKPTSRAGRTSPRRRSRGRRRRRPRDDGGEGAGPGAGSAGG